LVLSSYHFDAYAMSTTNYLVTGGNRGIGLGLVSTLLKRPHTIVVATVRNITQEITETLNALPSGQGSRVIIAKLDSFNDSDAKQVVEKLQKEDNIDRLDVVIANSAISKYYGPALSTPISEVREHFEVNAVAPLLLFQAVWPLLERSNAPKFVVISTGVASISQMGEWPIAATAYGGSKVMLNYFVRKIHCENEKLVAFPINPGWVQTDMGNMGARSAGMKEAPTTVEESVSGLLDKIDNATREKTSGTFQSFDGYEWKW